MQHKVQTWTEYTLSKERAIKLLDSLSDTFGFFYYGNLALLASPALFTAFPRQSFLLDDPKVLQRLKEPANEYLVAGLLDYEFGQITSRTHRKDQPTQATGSYIGEYNWYGKNDAGGSIVTLHFHPECDDAFVKRILSLANDEVFSPPDAFSLRRRFSKTIEKPAYLAAVYKIINKIESGDCYQVNYTQRFEAEFSGNAWLAFKELCSITEAQHCAFLNKEGASVISLSPELLLSYDNNIVETKPIKGTRARGNNASTDAALKVDLTKSEKDRAENLMIVDLLRNDLGKVCSIGSVKVTELFSIQSFSNVHQMVSTIQGSLSPSITPLYAMTQCFPGGSITGAPKIKAMEVIDELETTPRGPYCGSLFYLTPDGELVSNIAIRTLYTVGNKIYCHGGGGIVADSDPEAEYEESITKVKVFMDALEKGFLKN